MHTSLQHQFADTDQEHWWFQGRRTVIASVLRSHLPSPGVVEPRRIFDVGCGTGEMVDMLREFGRVSGIDTSTEAIDYSRKRLGDDVELRVGRIPEDLPTAGDVDVVTAFDVIEHLDDDLAALAAMYRALRPGGSIAVTVPAFQFLWGHHDELSHHKRRYTRAQLRRRLEESGFTVERISYYNMWLFPLVAGVRVGRILVRRAHKPQSDFRIPPPIVNRLLRDLFASEAGLLKLTSLPFGVSLLAVCRKPAD